MREKSCKACGDKFTPERQFQPCCSITCAIDHARWKRQKAAEKALRKDTRERKQRLKTLSEWLAEAQTACNAYIRERDKGLPCISCGNTKDVKYCAGHYKTRGGHPELRFHPFNINRQCDWYCNLNLSGNVSNYRIALIEKIGLKAVEWIEGPHQAQNYTIDDAKEIKVYYREQLKILKDSE